MALPRITEKLTPLRFSLAFHVMLNTAVFVISLAAFATDFSKVGIEGQLDLARSYGPTTGPFILSLLIVSVIAGTLDIITHISFSNTLKNYQHKIEAERNQTRNDVSKDRKTSDESKIVIEILENYQRHEYRDTCILLRKQIAIVMGSLSLWSLFLLWSFLVHENQGILILAAIVVLAKASLGFWSFAGNLSSRRIILGLWRRELPVVNGLAPTAKSHP